MYNFGSDHNFQCSPRTSKNSNTAWLIHIISNVSKSHCSYLQHFIHEICCTKSPSQTLNLRIPCNQFHHYTKRALGLTWIQVKEENGSHGNLAQCFRLRHFHSSIVFSSFYQVKSLIRYQTFFFFSVPQIICISCKHMCLV